ncbi:protein FLX-like 1 [Zingiber officinale]|uniref:protein FLX-like 1 n=1 Tax=Zingiber officinale TaxID=94328 RepID=UPI001C4BBC6C|nr:protein FLX-like 1 [Zingiber officinale]XP_042439189.1 protein FLX-like 1 [Zingiber officinale]
MSGRSRMPPPHAPVPPPPHHDAPRPPLFAGPGLLPIHPAALLEEAGRDGPPFGLHGGRPHPHPAVIEEHLAVQHQEIQGLLADNQRLAATHVALKQEVDAAQHEIRRMSHAFSSMQADKDLQIREVYEKSVKLESELRAVDAMKGELIQTRGDIQKLTAAKQELTGQVQALTQELTRTSADLQQAPAIKAEIEATKQEIQRVRAAIEYEKKGYAENYEQGQVMEKNLISIAREVEKLRAEVANAEKRARATTAAGNLAAGYGGNYGNPDPSYGGNQYPYGYGMNPIAGAADAGPQYGSGSGHSSWGAYDIQRDHGRK